MALGVVRAALLLAQCVSSDWAIAQTAVDRLESQVRESIGRGEPTREPGHLGVVLDDATRDQGGVVVRAVRPGSPAAEAGVRERDVITGVDAAPVRTFADFAAIMADKGAGERVEIALVRAGRPVAATATLGRPPAEAFRPGGPKDAPAGPTANVDENPQIAPDRLGLLTAEVTPDVAAALRLPDARGALVVFVATGSPAQQATIPRHAVLLAVDGKKIDTPADWLRMLAEAGNATIKVGFAYRGDLMERKIDLRAVAPVAPDSFGPAEPIASLPAPPATEVDAMRVESLERRVTELEARIAELEALLQMIERP